MNARPSSRAVAMNPATAASEGNARRVEPAAAQLRPTLWGSAAMSCTACGEPPAGTSKNTSAPVAASSLAAVAGSAGSRASSTRIVPGPRCARTRSRSSDQSAPSKIAPSAQSSSTAPASSSSRETGQRNRPSIHACAPARARPMVRGGLLHRLARGREQAGVVDQVREQWAGHAAQRVVRAAVTSLAELAAVRDRVLARGVP